MDGNPPEAEDRASEIPGVMDSEIDWLVELRGVYDGWSVAVLHDGRQINRWDDGSGAPRKGYERRWETVEAYLRGEESMGRWF